MLAKIEKFNFSVRSYKFIAARETFSAILELFKGENEHFIDVKSTRRSRAKERTKKKVLASIRGEKFGGSAFPDEKVSVGEFMPIGLYEKLLKIEEKLQELDKLDENKKDKEISMVMGKKEFLPVVNLVLEHIEEQYFEDFLDKTEMTDLCQKAVRLRLPPKRSDLMGEDFN